MEIKDGIDSEISIGNPGLTVFVMYRIWRRELTAKFIENWGPIFREDEWIRQIVPICLKNPTSVEKLEEQRRSRLEDPNDPIKRK